MYQDHHFTWEQVSGIGWRTACPTHLTIDYSNFTLPHVFGFVILVRLYGLPGRPTVQIGVCVKVAPTRERAATAL